MSAGGQHKNRPFETPAIGQFTICCRYRNTAALELLTLKWLSCAYTQSRTAVCVPLPPMHNVARRSLSYAHRLHFPAKRVAGRRLPIRSPRAFHSAARKHNSLPFPFSKPDDTPENAAPGAISSASSGSDGQSTSPKDVVETSTESAKTPQVRSASHGPAARRSTRNQGQPKQNDINPIDIPQWFYRHNVRLREEDPGTSASRLEILDKSGNVARRGDVKLQDAHKAAAGAATLSDAASHRDNATTDDAPVYRLSQPIMDEIVTCVAAGLTLSLVESKNSFAAEKSHLKLHCPIDGGVYFLENIVEQAAERLRADIIRIDAQDIAEIAGDYIKEGREATSNAIWTLGYDSQHMFPRTGIMESDEPIDHDEEDAEVMDEPGEGQSGRPAGWTKVTAFPVVSVSKNLNLGDLFKNLTQRGQGIRSMLEGGGRSGGRGNGGGGVSQGTFTRWDEHKLSELLKVLLNTNHQKRAERPLSTGTSEGKTDRQSNTKTIVLIRGMKELSATAQGGAILDKMFDLIIKKRKEDQQIMFVGVTASADLTPETSRSGIQSLQSEGPDLPYRTIVVAPEAAGPAGGVFYLEERRRIREINIRHIQDMVYRLSADSDLRDVDHQEFAASLQFGSGNASIESLLEEQYLTLDEVHRIAMLAVGKSQMEASHEANSTTAHTVRASDIVSAITLIDESDSAKIEWANGERQLQKTPTADPEAPKTSPSELKLRKLRRTCNRHEKPLLNGVVNPENIKTTFADVHAAPETIEALKTLTTLSLTRPDAFKYGVLAKDKITGVLLYGPPGTGKTLLAKAVAKESGATVLEVSGSDVYDMYVGESEKNVRAIFSLARKLSPCVVFVDEADAIFASRGSGTNRNSHRELINQFLREWDGMADTTALIMVATNRPFDLDDAALRRLPRRLLVDLPAERDRESILGIHLAGESLAPDVDLARLAAQTPLYSGSDLKNLAVAAALAAVLEENAERARAAADASVATDPPPRRTLRASHFAKAMEEIGASVSEDMSSLGAIRKFDERYGDRRGRRRRGAYGFGAARGVDEGAVKVRPVLDV